MKLNHNLKSYIKSYTHSKKDHIFHRKKKQKKTEKKREALKRRSSIRFVKHLQFYMLLTGNHCCKYHVCVYVCICIFKSHNEFH